MDPMFPALPEDLAALSAEELTELERQHVEAITKIRDKDAEFLADRDGATIINELKAGVEALASVRAQLASIAEEEANFDADVEALASSALSTDGGDDDGDGDGDDDGDADAEASADAEALAADDEAAAAAAEEDAEAAAADAAAAEGDADAVTASAVAASERRVRRSQAVARKHQPMVVRPEGEGRGAPLVSTMEFGGIQRGKSLDKTALVQLLDDAIVRSEGITQRTVLASARAKFPEDRLLDLDPHSNDVKLRAIKEQIAGTSLEAILASGGRCAPFTPLYDLPFVSTARRPVTAALAGFGAPRGGIQFPTPLTISDAAPGITIVTADEDATEGSASKACVVVSCDEFQSAETAAIAGCVEHGNFGARSWPERVDNLADLVRVAHAQAAETKLLDQIKLESNTVADEAKYGLTSTLIQGILKAGAAMRNRHRMEPDVTLRVLLPAWIIDAMVADVNHNAFNRFVAHAEMTATLARFNIAATFYLDGPTGGAMQYGTADTTNLDEFKTTVEWAIFPEGTWLFLDGGRLDLGLIRDSVLNETNDFQIFFETWEGAALVGVESMWVTSTICPSGATAPAGTLITC